MSDAPLSDPVSAPAAGGGTRRGISPTLLLWLAVTLAYALLEFQPLAGPYLGMGSLPRAIDVTALLAAGETAQRGGDVYQPMELDPLRRPHSYSSWWLVLGRLGLQRRHTPAVALLLTAGFFAAVAFGTRPRTAGEAGLLAAVLAAPPVMLAVHLGNNDLVIFVLLAGLPAVAAARGGVARWAGPLLVALAAGLKYYPAVAVVLLLTAPTAGEKRWRLLLAAVLLGLVAASVAPDLRHVASTLPNPHGLYSFGSRELLHQLGLPAWAGAALALLVLAAMLAAAIRRRAAAAAGVGASRSARCFFLGAVLLAGCFWAGANWSYRWVFAVWLMPWLWELHRRAVGRPRWLAGAGIGLLLFNLWFEGLASLGCNLLLAGGWWPAALAVDRLDRLIWLLGQPAQWVFFVALTWGVIRFSLEAAGWGSGSSATPAR